VDQEEMEITVVINFIVIINSISYLFVYWLGSLFFVIMAGTLRKRLKWC